MASMKARGSKSPRGTGPTPPDRAISHAIAASMAHPGAPLSTTAAADERVPTSRTAFVNSFASQDWLLIGYLSTILVALFFGKGSNRGACIVHVSGDLGAFVFVLALVRLQLLRWGGAASSLIYRFAIMATLLGTFFQLREILPAVSPWAMDARIYAFDLHVFGFEPSVWLDRFVNESTTEWFAFFYFLYFLILTVHVLPMLYWLRDERVLARFGVGFLMIFLTAHLLYMVVPGWGPYWYLRDSFQ